MKTQFDKLREKIHEAKNEINKEKNEVSFIFDKALHSVLATMEEIENEEEFIIGKYYFAWDIDEKGFIYGQLLEIDNCDKDLPYKMIFKRETSWYTHISKDLPKHLINPLNN